MPLQRFMKDKYKEGQVQSSALFFNSSIRVVLGHLQNISHLSLFSMHMTLIITSFHCGQYYKFESGSGTQPADTLSSAYTGVSLCKMRILMPTSLGCYRIPSQHGGLDRCPPSLFLKKSKIRNTW